MMAKMGYKAGGGLGRDGQGHAERSIEGMGMVSAGGKSIINKLKCEQ